MATKIAKFKKLLEKQGINTEVRDPDRWLSSNILLLNNIMSSNLHYAVPNRRSVLFWGESGTGKTFLLSNIASEALKAGYTVFYVDTEFAIERLYFEKCGIDYDSEAFNHLQLNTVEEITVFISELCNYFDVSEKIFIAIDSLSNVQTASDVTNFDKGEVKGDQGQQAKQLKSLVKNINRKIGVRDMFVTYSGHAYLNQDIKSGEGKWLFSGGKGVQYILSISVLLTKLDLKEGTDIVGIKMRAKVSKSRFNGVGGKAEIELNYETGFEPWAGMLDIAVKKGLVAKTGSWYTYAPINEEPIKFQRSKFGQYYERIFNIGAATKELPVETEGFIDDDYEEDVDTE